MLTRLRSWEVLISEKSCSSSLILTWNLPVRTFSEYHTFHTTASRILCISNFSRLCHIFWTVVLYTMQLTPMRSRFVWKQYKKHSYINGISILLWILRSHILLYLTRFLFPNIDSTNEELMWYFEVIFRTYVDNLCGGYDGFYLREPHGVWKCLPNCHRCAEWIRHKIFIVTVVVHFAFAYIYVAGHIWKT